MLQYVAVRNMQPHGVLIFPDNIVKNHDISACCSMLQCALQPATHCNTLQHTATHLNILQHTATYSNVLEQTATYCNTLQHTAAHRQ